MIFVIYNSGEQDIVARLSPQLNLPSQDRETERVQKKSRRKKKDIIIRDFAEIELDTETLARLNQGEYGHWGSHIVQQKIWGGGAGGDKCRNLGH